MVSRDVSFLETTLLFPSIDPPSQGEDDDLLIYTVTSSFSDLTESVTVKPLYSSFTLGDVFLLTHVWHQLCLQMQFQVMIYTNCSSERNTSMYLSNVFIIYHHLHAPLSLDYIFLRVLMKLYLILDGVMLLFKR